MAEEDDEIEAPSNTKATKQPTDPPPSSDAGITSQQSEEAFTDNFTCLEPRPDDDSGIGSSQDRSSSDAPSVKYPVPASDYYSGPLESPSNAGPLVQRRAAAVIGQRLTSMSDSPGLDELSLNTVQNQLGHLDLQQTTPHEATTDGQLSFPQSLQPVKEWIDQPLDESIDKPARNEDAKALKEDVGQPLDEIIDRPDRNEDAKALKEDVGQPLDEIIDRPGRNEDAKALKEDVGQPLDEIIDKPDRNEDAKALKEDVGQPLDEIIDKPARKEYAKALKEDVDQPLDESIDKPARKEDAKALKGASMGETSVYRQLTKGQIHEIRVKSGIQIDPNYPCFVTSKSRKATFPGTFLFCGVPADSTIFADSGFFYRKLNGVESVTCFHCGASILDWDDDMSITTEHVMLAPRCRMTFYN